MLMMQHPVGIRDRIDIQEPILSALFAKLRDAREQTLACDSAVDHDMGHMDALWPKLARDALCEGALRRLGRGEGGKIGLAAKTSRSSCKEQRAAAIAKQHRDRRLAQLKSTKRVFTPMLLEGGFAELEERPLLFLPRRLALTEAPSRSGLPLLSGENERKTVDRRGQNHRPLNDAAAGAKDVGGSPTHAEDDHQPRKHKGRGEAV